MRRFFKWLVVVFVVLLAIGGGLYVTGGAYKLFIMAFKPNHGFDLSLKAPTPDYADPVNWAALPETEDLADSVPEGVAPRTEAAPIDVFFIHPTGYMNNAEWNSPMNPESNTEENTYWMMANQASTFNSCCEVYAPRYREASIFAYFVGDPEMLEQALDFAYQDVERAFDHFIANRSNGRPFIIASHSQGTHHAMTLLKRRITGTPLRDRMVAAYIIGSDATYEKLAELPDIDVCDAPDDLQCVNHWATFGEGGKADRSWVQGSLVCTNPLSWRDQGRRVEAEAHKGGVLSSGEFSFGFAGPDEPKGIEFGPLGTPIPNVTWAECQDGLLIVQDLSKGPFHRGTRLPGKNYHGHDYPLFHMNIRENTQVRTKAYLAQRENAVPADEEE